MENNFVSNLRNAFQDYDKAAKSYKMPELEREWEKEKARKLGARTAADAAYFAGSAATSAGVSTGHPIAMGIGAGLGALNALAGNYILTKNETTHTKERKRILDEMQKENTRSWTEFKNDTIDRVGNGKFSVASLAKDGKMVTDDGDIVDIDYDYYAKVPQETLERVFGEEGAKSVSKKISERKKKK